MKQTVMKMIRNSFLYADAENDLTIVNILDFRGEDNQFIPPHEIENEETRKFVIIESVLTFYKDGPLINRDFGSTCEEFIKNVEVGELRYLGTKTFWRALERTIEEYETE